MKITKAQKVKYNKNRRIKRKKFKLETLLKDIKQRCNNPKNNIYKYYGGKGIKCELTLLDLQYLWEYYNAQNLINPSINRKNHNKNYYLENCEFIEKSDNIAERNKRICSKPILQYDLEGNFIREWESAKEAERQLNCSNIVNVLKGRYKQDKGFVWRYKA